LIYYFRRSSAFFVSWSTNSELPGGPK
jgi:hypothetical protein